MGLLTKSLLAVLVLYSLRNAESRSIPEGSIVTSDGEIDISRFAEATVVLNKMDAIMKGALGAAAQLDDAARLIRKQRDAASVERTYKQAVQGVLDNLQAGKSKIERLLKALAQRVRSHVKSTVSLAKIIGETPRQEMLSLPERAEKNELEPIAVLEVNPNDVIDQALKKKFRARDYPKNLYGKKTSSYKKLPESCARSVRKKTRSNMVYESDFYTTRRPYTRPSPTISSYSITTPRHYVVTDSADRPRRAEEQYSYSYSSESVSRSSPNSAPTRSYSTTSERVNKSYGGGPGSYNYSTERSSRSSDSGRPGSYHSSYSSTTSGRLPGGTTYRHFAYRV